MAGGEDPGAFDAEAVDLLRLLTGDADALFRPDQLEVIRLLADGRRRALLVQRTGWGKSAVYFIATRMLRGRGAGPTLLISPLLALMRNQIEAAERMGVRARSINSANREEWGEIVAEIEQDAIDVLLISPERLANPHFRAEILPEVGSRSGLFVIDEAHCISDWGHDFRPDYRRLVRVLDLLPAGVPVLCCTATANDRVVADVVAQLGSGLEAVRGPLGREGLQLQVLSLDTQAERLAWLAATISNLDGTGIIYCLTIKDTLRVAGWLKSRGIEAVAYSGETDRNTRLEVERGLLDNDLKVVVATSALGMGFDKPDLSFVIHYQAPGSPIAYYQQVGRAGRALDQSWGLLLGGDEDKDIQDYFIRTAFPEQHHAEQVVALLQTEGGTMGRREILERVNIRTTQLAGMMKVLEVEGAIERANGGWRRTLKPWSYDARRVSDVTALRQAEQQQMIEYRDSRECRMQLLRRYLDDPDPDPCGICDNCSHTSLDRSLPTDLIVQAERYLRSAWLPIGPRVTLPGHEQLAERFRFTEGRVLCIWGDGGWGPEVRRGKQDAGRFSNGLLDAAVELVRGTWRPHPAPRWVTYVPSLRTPELVFDFASRLASRLGLPCHDVVEKVRVTEPQKFMQNSLQQYRNVAGVFRVGGSIPPTPVLLVDDIVDSRWTLTAVSAKLLEAGSGPVFPFALADTSGRST